MKILYSFLTLLLVSTVVSAQPSVWTSTGIGAGGALYSPSINPTNPSEIYVASAASAMFRTTDLAASWQTVNFRTMQTSDYVISKVQFTSNPNLLYVLATDPETGFSLPMKSTDAGASWLPIDFDPTDGGGITLIVDYASPNRLLISDYSTIYLSTDGGQNFTNKYDDATGYGCHVAGAFFDGNSIYIGTNAGVLASTNNGTSFTLMNLGNMPIGEAIVSFSGAKQGATTRFFAVTLDELDVYPGVTGSQYASFLGLYSHDVGSANWSYRVTGVSGSDFPFYVAAAAGNINVAYAAGSGDKGTPIVYKTTNGGLTWTKTFNTTLNAGIATAWQGFSGDRDWTYGSYVTGFDVSRSDPNRLVITDLGGMYLSINGSTAWRQAYVNILGQNPAGAATPTKKYYQGVGLENSRVWNVAWADSVNILAACSDIRAIASNDAGKSWSFNYTGLTTFDNVYYTLKHPTTGVLYAATSNVADIYQSTCLTDDKIDAPTANGQVMYSADKGKTWLLAHTFQHPVMWLAVDPGNPNRLYASVASSAFGGIYVTDNINAGAGSTWTRLAAPPRTQGHAFAITVLKDGSLVCSYSARRAGSPLAFTQSAGVFLSTDGGKTWTDRSDANLQYWTKDVVIDPHDATQNTWYACSYSGYGADGSSSKKGGLYRTTDRGQTWTKIAGIDRVSSCTINPLAPNEMYMTTESEGLWYTSNLTSPAPVFSEVTGYPFRQPERVFFNPYKLNEIWVTSFGNGIRIGTGTLPSAPTAPTLASPANDSTGVPTTRFLYWNISPTAANYRVQLSTVATFGTTIKDTTISTPYYKFIGLTENTKYYWRVAGANLVGTGAWSTVWNFTTVNNVQMPQAPSLLSPTNDTIGAFTSRSLYWNAVAGAETYHVQLSQDKNFGSTIIDQTGLLNPTYGYSGLAQGAKYYWRVSATNTAGTGAWSDVWSFTTKSAIGVDEPQALTGMWLECTPNPIVSYGEVSFSLPRESSVRLVIVDILGAEIATLLNDQKSAGLYTLPIEMPLQSGTYWIRLQTSFGIMTKQIQVVR